MEFLAGRAREVALLSGPDGDSYFSERLEHSIKKTCDTAWHAGAGKRTEEDHDRLCAAIIRTNSILPGSARG